MIGVYKFRTMHPYSEYLQDYVIKKNGYSEIGKPADDFRLTSWGGTMRKLWLDELPQLINVVKGEMKLVGIRPVSKRFLEEYPDDMKELRLKHKPGCVPPYVALLKQEVGEYIESERTYLKEKELNPYTTDTKYFFRAVYNILSNKIRSS
jgi:lipopolysaccharide/colanic/teichoic acid biosynthesis glycosyltransferase